MRSDALESPLLVRGRLRGGPWLVAGGTLHHGGAVKCDVCGVDHETTMADLSHGIIRLIHHAQEARPWNECEWPISGDRIALQRAGRLSKSLIGSVDWGALGEEEGWNELG